VATLRSAGAEAGALEGFYGLSTVNASQACHTRTSTWLVRTSVGRGTPSPRVALR
jgi:hypothetical protein